MSVTQTYVSVAQEVDYAYDLTGYFLDNIVAEEAAGANPYVAFVKYAWQYRDAMTGIYQIATYDDYPEGFQEAAIFIVVASVMGKFIPTEGAIATLNQAADILTAYEAALGCVVN